MKYRMKMVKLADIDASNRYREDMGDIEELAAGIAEKGLIQPMCVNSELRLLAGGRRHAACTLLKLVDVPVLIREGTDEVDAREIELMENIHRKEMTWQEQAKLTARIHSLYKEKDPNWNQTKTAQLIEQNKMNVSRALMLDAGLKVLPSLAECKTADEATKVIKKAEADAIVAELAKRQQATIQTVSQNVNASEKEKGLAATLKLANLNYKIGDTFAGMASLKTDGNVDFIECDPPYGVDLGTIADRSERGEVVRNRDSSYHEIPREEYPAFLDKLAKETYRIAGKNSWMVFWFAFEWYDEVLSSLVDAGWKVDKVPAMWYKANGRTPRPDILLARAYEPFFIARKGQPTIIRQGRTNVFLRSPDEKKYHPAQRPVALMEDLMNTLMDEGRGKVVVPFAGSGATLRAAYKLGHEVVGWDSNDEYKDPFLLAVEEDTKKLLNQG